MTPRYARMTGDVVAEVFDFEPVLHEALEVVAVPVEVEPNWRRTNGVFEPPPPVAVAPPVPLSVSSAQAKIALNRAGWLPAVRAAIEALGDDEATIWFTDARVWERDNPRVVAIGEAVGLAGSEIDDLFRIAELIAA